LQRVNDANDPEIVIRLPLTAVQLIIQHLYLGLYVGNPVFSIVNAIFDQATPQINLAVGAAATPRTNESVN
jgi:hypothetical protein